MSAAVLFVCAFAPWQIAVTQTVNDLHPVEESAARKNLLEHRDPIYPPIAKAAHIQGTVEIAVIINPAGKVSWEKALTGPAMLQQSALDAVHQWTFKPFRVDGSAVSVSATLEIPFQIDKPGEGPTKEQQEAAQAYFPLEDKCRSDLKSKDAESSVSSCKAALDMSLRAGDSTTSDQLGMMDAHQLYGHALLLTGRLSDALAEENSAIEESRKCLTDKDQEYAMPFFWRAMVEARLGQIDATLSDLTIAEKTHRKAIANLPDMKKTYSQYLASILRQHAALLDQLGRSAEAKILRTEADSL